MRRVIRIHCSFRTMGVSLALACVLAVVWRYSPRAAPVDEGRCDVSSLDPRAEELDLRSCGLHSLPPDIAVRFPNLVKLDASGNSLSDLPALPAGLQTLFLTGNRFTRLPGALMGLQELRMVSFRRCRLQGSLASGVLPRSLVWLILTENSIETLPGDLGGDACGLVKLMLANNHIRELPPALAGCTSLELIRLANNRLTAVPTWLLTLPSLAWLALGGNPLVRSPAADGVPTLPATAFSIDKSKALGSGTSGVVYRGSILASGEPVAVKLYKTTTTSDGTTSDEARASAAAGSHVGLIRTLALVGTSTALEGIALEWLEGWSQLGNTPSFTTISRDVYPPGKQLPVAFVGEATRVVCHALQHLHAKGRQIMHGDVYSHNMMMAMHNGSVKLGDFGAAFAYGAMPEGWRLERIEVRAYGIWMWEMLDLVAPAPSSAAVVRDLRHIARQASVRDTDRRPPFANLCTMVETALRGGS